MKFVFTILFSILLPTVCFGQGRQTALDQFNALKGTAAAIERLVLAPSDDDVAAAEGENGYVVRLLPRETYDNSFTSIRGGGSYYSFFIEFMTTVMAVTSASNRVAFERASRWLSWVMFR